MRRGAELGTSSVRDDLEGRGGDLASAASVCQLVLVSWYCLVSRGSGWEERRCVVLRVVGCAV